MKTTLFLIHHNFIIFASHRTDYAPFLFSSSIALPNLVVPLVETVLRLFLYTILTKYKRIKTMPVESLYLRNAWGDTQHRELVVQSERGAGT